ncbi:MAG: hypothetical protein KKE73_10965 [Proteobacteria bacterium]|nr:hypothetical protein [Pseudomonadota bacterium]
MAAFGNSPIARHFNTGFALPNPQASGATGRKIGGLLPVTTAKRALMQGQLPSLGAGIGGSGTAVAAIDALGPTKDYGVGTVVDSPGPVNVGGGKGPMGTGAAPGGLGSSNSNVESSRDSGRVASVTDGVNVTSGGKMSLGNAFATASPTVGKAALDTGMQMSSVPSASFGDIATAFGANLAAGGVKSLADRTLGFIADKTAQAVHDYGLKSRADETDFANPTEVGTLAPEIGKTPTMYGDLSARLLSPITDAWSQSKHMFGFDPAYVDALEALGYNPDMATRAEMSSANKLTSTGNKVTSGVQMSMERTAHDKALNALNSRNSSFGKGRGGIEGPGAGGYADNDTDNASNDTGFGPEQQEADNPGFNGPNYSNNNDNGPDNGPDDGGSIICTELHEQGLMSDADLRLGYRHMRKHIGLSTVRGYHVWARPVVRWMKKSKIMTAVWRWIWMHRHNEVRRAMGKTKKVDLIGVGIRFVGEGLSWVIGQCCATDPVNSQWNRKPWSWSRRERTA